jgi:hypothetical protein
MLDQLLLNFSVAGWIFFLLMWILIAVAVFYYRRTLPPLSRPRRIFLTVVRSLILVMIFFIFFQPVIQLIIKRQEKPAVAILLDNSRSMTIKDSYGLRGDSLRYALANLRKFPRNDSLAIRIYEFSQNLLPLADDTLSFSGGQTNISIALESVLDSLLQYNIQSVFLLSDGQFNQGANPLITARNSPIVINTITVGDSTRKKDIEITGIRCNSVVYTGDTLTVRTSILQTGFDNAQVVVRLRRGAEQLAAQVTNLPSSGFQTEVDFPITAGKPGETRYSVEVDPLKDEVNNQNNRKTFVLNVLKSRLKVLLLSGQASFDERMLIYAMQQIPAIRYSVLTEDVTGQFYENDFQKIPLDSQDIFLFLGYPTRRSHPAVVNALLQSLKSAKKPLFLVLDESTNLNSLKPVEDILPFSGTPRISEGQTAMVSLSTAGLLHPATRIEENPQLTMNLWKDLPPVTVFGKNLLPARGAAVLLTTGVEEGIKPEPVLLASVRQETKSLLLCASGFGSWHFQLQDDPLRESFFRNFVENSLRWLVSREDIQKIQIHPNQKVYRLGEFVEFSGQVLDEFYHQVQDASVKISITGQDYQLDDVIPNQGGFYDYRAAGFPSGTYDYEIQASRGDLNLGKISGKFVVEQLELEMQTGDADPGLMRQLAAEAGGKSGSIRHFIQNINNLQLHEQVQMLTLDYVLWNKIYWLIALILLLSLEWFFRKRWGLL